MISDIPINSKIRSKINGFTLIEITVVIIIVGILAGLSSSIMTSVFKSSREKALKTQMHAVEAALEGYINQYGHLPCPAPLYAKMGEAEFGTSMDCQDKAIKPGYCDTTRGFCVAAGQVFDDKGKLQKFVETNRVRIGAIPVRTLNLPFNVMQDPWSNPIFYAVPETLASSAQDYLFHPGVMDVLDMGGYSVLTPKSSAAYAVWSLGQNARGQLVPEIFTDNASCTEDTVEYQNCKYRHIDRRTAKMRAPLAVFRTAPKSLGQGPQYFDDHIIYGRKRSDIKYNPYDCANLPACSVDNIESIDTCRISNGDFYRPLCVQREDLKGGADERKPDQHNLTTWKTACDWGHEGWAVPTIEELRIIQDHVEEIGGFKYDLPYLTRSYYNPLLSTTSDRKIRVWSIVLDKGGEKGTEREVNISPHPRDRGTKGYIRCVLR